MQGEEEERGTDLGNLHPVVKVLEGHGHGLERQHHALSLQLLPTQKGNTTSHEGNALLEGKCYIVTLCPASIECPTILDHSFSGANLVWHTGTSLFGQRQQVVNSSAFTRSWKVLIHLSMHFQCHVE